MDDRLAPDISALLSEHDEAQADIALAQMLQEQEDAWFAQGLILPTHHTEISQQGARHRSGNEQSNATEADSDRRFALEVQHAELRDHVARLAAAHQGDEEGDDIDDMTYEQLTALGDTIGSVKVGVSEAARAKHLMLQSYSNVCKERKVTDDTCTICQHCFAEDDQVYVLPCQHCFHDQCVATWFKVSKVCPVCKYEISDRTSEKRQ